MFLLILILLSSEVMSAYQLHVSDKMNHTGIVCDVFLKNSEGKDIHKGPTNAQGFIALTEPGQPGEYYFTRKSMFYSGKINCPLASEHTNEIEIESQKLDACSGSSLITASDFASAAELALSQGKAAHAALNFEKASDLAREKSPVWARELENKVIESVGYFFEVKNPFARERDTLVMSEELTEKVKNFQKEHLQQSSPKGNLDTKTLKALKAYDSDEKSQK